MTAQHRLPITIEPMLLSEDLRFWDEKTGKWVAR